MPPDSSIFRASLPPGANCLKSTGKFRISGGLRCINAWPLTNKHVALQHQGIQQDLEFNQTNKSPTHIHGYIHNKQEEWSSNKKNGKYWEILGILEVGR